MTLSSVGLLGVKIVVAVAAVAMKLSSLAHVDVGSAGCQRMSSDATVADKQWCTGRAAYCSKLPTEVEQLAENWLIPPRDGSTGGRTVTLDGSAAL